MKASLFFLMVVLTAGCGHRHANRSLAGTAVNIGAIPFPLWQDGVNAGLQIFSGDSLLFASGGGTDLHHPASGVFKKHNAPKLLFHPDNDFEYSACLRPTVEAKYNGGGMLLYTDTSNWAKVLFQHSGTTAVLGMSVVRKGITDDSYFNIADGKSLYLKIRKKGAVCAFYTSTDGTEWALARQFVYPLHCFAGFFAQSPAGNGCTVTISSIRYSKL